MKLKKIYILLSLSLAGMTTFSACQDFLSEKPYSFVGPEEVGNDDAAVSQWVTGVYSKWADDMFRWGNFPRVLDMDCDYASGPDWAFSKPLWSPFVDLVKTKRAWIIAMQGFIAAGFAGIAFFIPTAHYVQLTLAFFWLLAFSSATHDIAADGFYMLGLNNKEQSFFVGIRNTFYRLANIFGQGILVMLAGWLETSQNNIPLAWSITFYLLAGLFLALTIYHRLILPHPDSDIKRPGLTPGKLLGDFLLTFVTFFKKKNLGLMFFFLLTYRLGESQLAKIASPFLLDATDKGGLALSTATVGMIYGTIGVIALLVGGIISGFLVSRDGFRKWILPMALAINLPDLLYVWMAAATPDNPIFIAICVAIEQLGYGFGFTAYMLYLIYIAEGEHKTAHYAIGTGFMALGMMLPGMPAGWIQEHLG